nr:MAG TPA: hypothetical protein [Caudoviricetes sp.]
MFTFQHRKEQRRWLMHRRQDKKYWIISKRMVGAYQMLLAL